jgi:hypothetical protein
MEPNDSPSGRLQQLLLRSRALSPADVQTVIALADLAGVTFVRLEPKGAVLDDVLTGISGTIHSQKQVALKVIETFLGLDETVFTLKVIPLGVAYHHGFEIQFTSPEV